MLRRHDWRKKNVDFMARCMQIDSQTADPFHANRVIELIAYNNIALEINQNKIFNWMYRHRRGFCIFRRAIQLVES